MPSPIRASSPAAVPAFQRIKDYVLQQIHSGTWQEGDAIPSEAALARQFEVARMTVNRALRELSDEQTLTRVQGSGTFVAQQKYQSTLVQLRNIADEIAARGHAHRSELFLLEKSKANETLAAEFGVAANTYLFHSVMLHFENDEPIQVEERWVNPSVAPEYLQQDFSRTTPNEYLVENVPLQSGEYTVEALPAPEAIAEMLHIKKHEACLVLQRKTLSMNQVATLVTMWHPGARYQFSGKI